VELEGKNFPSLLIPASLFLEGVFRQDNEGALSEKFGIASIN